MLPTLRNLTHPKVSNCFIAFGKYFAISKKDISLKIVGNTENEPVAKEDETAQELSNRLY